MKASVALAFRFLIMLSKRLLTYFTYIHTLDTLHYILTLETYITCTTYIHYDFHLQFHLIHHGSGAIAVVRFIVRYDW